MSAETKFFKLGAFVLAGVAVAVGAVVVLGAGSLMRKKVLAESYVDESVQGLDVGAPVKFRGVTVGRLDDVPPAEDVASVLGRIREACGRLLKALDRPADLLDTALADGQPPGAIADRIAAAVLPDAALRQELLETLDVTKRLDRLSGALDGLVNELLGGRE